MKDLTSKIVHSLNESVDTVSIENEPIVGVNEPKQVHKCDNCADFYLVDEKKSESVCPECGSTGHPFGDITECDADPAKISSPQLDEEEEDELHLEAEELVNEGLRLLDRNDYKRFNEAYRPRSRVNHKGELEMMVESNGHIVTASRRMTSRQKSAYALSERYVTSDKVSTARSKKNEAIKMHRQELMVKNECRAVKIQACRLLERQGVKYDFKKFNEGMNKFLRSRMISESIKRISEDDEIGTSELDKMTPDEIGDQVNDVIKDTGLEVISNDVEIDGDTASVNVRVQDSDEVEVLASEVQDVLQDVFDNPVEIVGPYEADGDKTVQDLTVIINPDSDMNEDEDLDDDPELNENDQDTEDEPVIPTISEDDEEEDGTVMKESMRKRRSRRSRRRNESFVEGTGNTPLFALVSNMTVGNKNNAPEFLAHDDSLVLGSDADAEKKARTFVSYDAAEKFLQDAGLEDKFTPKAITIVTNEGLDDSDFGSEDSVNEEDDDDRELFETEDGTYFKKDGSCFKESVDGTIKEIDESEFEDAKETADEISKIQESFRRRNAKRRKSRR